MMPEWLDAVFDMLCAAFILVIAGAALGQAIDNYASRMDPSSPYYANRRFTNRPAPCYRSIYDEKITQPCGSR